MHSVTCVGLTWCIQRLVHLVGNKYVVLRGLGSGPHWNSLLMQGTRDFSSKSLVRKLAIKTTWDRILRAINTSVASGFVLENPERTLTI